LFGTVDLALGKEIRNSPHSCARRNWADFARRIGVAPNVCRAFELKGDRQPAAELETNHRFCDTLQVWSTPRLGTKKASGKTPPSITVKPRIKAAMSSVREVSQTVAVVSEIRIWMVLPP
jgi:hypothetical protein